MADTTIQERLEALTVLGETDKALFHDIVHGGVTDTVVTEGGSVPSVAKAISDVQAEINATLAKVKDPVLVATTANITLSGTQTIDGNVLVAGDRVLVKDQTSPAENGIYIVAAGAWSRAADFAAWIVVPGSIVIVKDGTTNHDTGWLCTSNDGGTLGSTSIVFAEWYGATLWQPKAANLTALALLASITNLSTIAALASIVNLSTLANLSAVDNLSALQGVTGAADKMLYFTGVAALAVISTTSYGRSLLNAADAAALRTLGGVGTIATQAANSVSITGGTINGATVTGLSAPSASSDAVDKATLDAAIAGLGKRGRVRAATTANITLSGAQTIDGVSVVAGDLVLVKNQSTQANNGVYDCAAGAWSRNANYDTWVEIEGCLLAVEEGSTLADTLWLCTANSGGTLSSTALTFAQIFPGSGGTMTQVSASEGIATGDGNPINVSGSIKLDVNGLTEDTAPDEAADFLVAYDASGTVHKKSKFTSWLKRISNLTAWTAPVLADVILIYDSANSLVKKITFDNFMKALNALTEDTSPDTASDFVMTWDASASAVKKVKLSNAAPPVALPKGYLSGLVQSNGTDATNDIDVTAGKCRDATDAVDITVAAITKQLDAAWAVGTNAGGRDTGSIADGMWAVWAIKRSDTGVTDVLFSTSFSAPTMPTNYDYKRLIGAICRASSTIKPFTHRGGDYFHYREAASDYTQTGWQSAISYVSVTCSVPPSSLAHVRAGGIAAYSSNDSAQSYCTVSFVRPVGSSETAVVDADSISGVTGVYLETRICPADASKQLQTARAGVAAPDGSGAQTSSGSNYVKTQGFTMTQRSTP